jgi:aryl-alcohol dehydrogenase-like predicted oxidoreductase
MMKKIGRSELLVYPIGQGTLFGRNHNLRLNKEIIKVKRDVLRYGIELGMNFVDTGEDYEGGLSEEILGDISKDIRSNLVIATKFKPINNSKIGIEIALNGSLKRLKTDYIDLYQIQWPNPSVSLIETIGALEDLVKKGKIRYFGVGNFSSKQIEEVLNISQSSNFIAAQTEYDLFNREIENEFIDYTDLNSISIIAYLSHGKDLFNPREKKILENISNKYEVSIRSIILNWIITRKNIIVLSSSMSKEHTKQNFLSGQFKMDADDVQKINSEFKRKILKIKPNEIKVPDFDESDNAHQIYTTVEQAIENKLNIKPDAKEISREILSTGKLLRPIELKKNQNKKDKQKYILVRGRMRFWGWIIAYGQEKELDCLVFDDY